MLEKGKEREAVESDACYIGIYILSLSVLSPLLRDSRVEVFLYPIGCLELRTKKGH